MRPNLRPRSLTAVQFALALALATLLPLLAPVATNAAPAVAPSIEMVTSRPNSNPHSSNSVYGRLMDLVAAADPGSKILVAQFRVKTGTKIVDDLIKALQDAESGRNIEVRFVVDDGTTSAVVSHLRNRGFAVTRCSANCVGGNVGAQHSKFVAFSSIHGRRVTFAGSSNWTKVAFANKHEVATVIEESAASDPVYSAHRRRFVDFETGRLTPEDAAVQVSNQVVEVAFFPMLDGDPIAEALELVRAPAYCRYTGALGKERLGRLRIAMSRGDSKREEVIDKLIELQQAGCKVQIFANKQSRSMLQELADSGFPVFDRAEGNRFKTGAWCVDEQHAKEMIFRGPYQNAIRKVAWMGSHNLELGNLRNTSDTWYETRDRASYRTLNRHMTAMFDDVIPCGLDG